MDYHTQLLDTMGANEELTWLVCEVAQIDFGFFVPFEEYLDNHKSDYYYYLDTGLQNTNDYLLFMLTSFLSQVEDLKNRIGDEEKKKTILTPRLEEIYNIIKARFFKGYT